MSNPNSIVRGETEIARVVRGTSDIYRVYQGQTIIWDLSKSYATMKYTTRGEEMVIPNVSDPFGTGVTVSHVYGKYTIFSSTNNGIEIVDDAFSGFTSLPTLITTLELVNIKKIGHRAFAATNITSIKLGNVEIIGDQAFDLCYISALTIPSTVTTIGWSAFADILIEELDIPNSVTQLGEEVFLGCRHLKSASIGTGISILPDYCFFYCKNLTNISYKGTVAQWGLITKGYLWNDNVPATVVHCTDGDVPI